jgi:hypothetical protein
MLTAFVGHTDSLVFARWFPLFIEALYLAPVIVIGSYAGVSRRTKWLGVAFFFAADWIYQDYFSPQALDYFFYLVVVASVLALWSPGRRGFVTGRGLIATKLDQVRNAWRLKRLTGEQTVAAYETPTVFALLVIITLIMLAIVMSHQLTPYALILALVACLVTSRLGRPELLAFAIVLSVGWLSLGASDFWMGHLSVIFGGVGQLSNNLGSNVVSRVVGSASHRFIVSSRIGFTAAFIAMAGVGALRRATDSRTLEFLVAAPFVILGLQGYGGEGLLRVVLFGLPFTSLLAASAIVPTRTGEVRPWIPPMKWLNSVATLRPAALLRPATAAIILIAMCSVTVIVRGGNDAYESYSAGELNAVNYVYDHIGANQALGVVVTYLPLGQRDVGTLSVVAMAGDSYLAPHQIATSLLQLRPRFIILSQSQEAWGEVVAGYNKGWETQLASTILNKDYRLVAAWTTAQVYEAYNKWGPLPS